MGFSRGPGQRTLKRRVSLAGIGVHSGERMGLTLGPADPDSGISFIRLSGSGAPDVEHRARIDAIGSTELCTVLGAPGAGCVMTVEHVLAALAGLGVDNATVEVDGPEIPVMDGSAEAFVDAIDQAGLLVQRAPRRSIRIRKPVRVELGASFAEFLPHEGCRFEIGIAFDCPAIGDQWIGLDLTPASFRKEVARARTFGFMQDVERLWGAGYALGASLDNSVVLADGKVLNPEGLRYPDEFVRHKLLDAIGDLALAGAPFQGLYRSHRGGHRLNALAVSTLLAHPEAWSMVASPGERESRSEGRVDLVGGLVSPAFAPETL